jgi:flagellar basal-body rod protein FlgF
MENALYIALSRQMTLRERLNVVANNLANATTGGFMADQMLFAEHLEKVETKSGRPGSVSFVRLNGIARDTRPGAFVRTDNPLDLAIEGRAYFTLQTPAGTGYTRNGRFLLDANGQIVNERGLPLLDTGEAPITVPPTATNITIANDGTVASGDQIFGKIRLAAFENEQILRRGDGYFLAGDVQPIPPERASLRQGMLEESNVKPMIEVTNMIELQRAYSQATQFLEREDERQRSAIERLARVG